MDQEGVVLAAAGAAAIIAALALLRVNGRPGWRATVTPLASIIGSGFLVAAPLLVETFGGGAIVAMAVLLMVAYAFGHVVRFNIRHTEPLLAHPHPDRSLGLFEGLSDAALSLAYFISVAYYLVLLGTFGLKGFGIENEVVGRWVTTGILLFIGALGVRGGLKAVERVESGAVALKLVIIAALCAGLLAALVFADQPPTHWPSVIAFSGDNLVVLLGLLIVTQGFETSRYLGTEFSPEVRIRTMRVAQLLAAAIYIVFFALITPFLGGSNSGTGVTALVDIAGTLAVGLAAAVTVGAAASQFTAAVADSIASTGLLHEVTRGRLAPRLGYLVLIPISIALVWLTDVIELVSYASRSFAVYYALQCGVALRAVYLDRTTVTAPGVRMAAYSAFGLLAMAVVIFGAPVAE